MTDAALVPAHVNQFLARLELMPVRDMVALPPEQRLDHAALGDRLELAGLLYKGFALLDLKQQMAHGDYLPALAARGIAPRSAARAINVARLSQRVSESNWPTLANLDATKVALIANWTDDELARFFAGEVVRGVTVEETRLLSYRDLERLVKEHDPDTRQLQQDLAREQSVNRRLRLQLEETERRHSGAAARGASEWPEAVRALRLEAVAETERAVLCVDAMARLAATCRKGLADLDAEAQYAAASALYHNTRWLLSRASELATALQEQFGHLGDLGDPAQLPILTASELDDAARHYERLVDDAELRRRLRQQQRDMDAPLERTVR